MTDHATFLAAIIARPDDDLPRLVYADALEKGDEFPSDAERAEFIRVQCELARLGYYGFNCTPDPTNGRGDFLRRREAELLEWASAKNAPWWPSTAFRFDSAKFVRGFVESLTCSWSDFRTHAAAIRKATPLRKVRLTTRPEWNGHHWNAAITDRWLKRDYPGIEFELTQQRDNIADIVASTIGELGAMRLRDIEESLRSR